MRREDMSLTPWVRLSSVEMKAIPSAPGVYLVSVGRPIHRVVGIDKEGLLDIGESNDLRYRIRSFVRCATNRGCEGHMAGWRFAYLKMAQHFSLDSLLVRWATAPTKKAAKGMEAVLLAEYLGRHFEQPPLNYSASWWSEDAVDATLSTYV